MNNNGPCVKCHNMNCKWEKEGYLRYVLITEKFRENTKDTSRNECTLGFWFPNVSSYTYSYNKSPNKELKSIFLHVLRLVVLLCAAKLLFLRNAGCASYALSHSLTLYTCNVKDLKSWTINKIIIKNYKGLIVRFPPLLLSFANCVWSPCKQTVQYCSKWTNKGINWYIVGWESEEINK